jgi:hypothetical protein
MAFTGNSHSASGPERLKLPCKLIREHHFAGHKYLL